MTTANWLHASGLNQKMPARALVELVWELLYQ